ncbi:MAG: acyltransferase [Verrucomicrobia bacterium]|nr:acyltransferase [Verrucomicrobiota bacterium]
MEKNVPDKKLPNKETPHPRQHKPYKKGLIRRIILGVRNLLIDLRRWHLTKVLGMDIDSSCRFSLKANFDLTNPKGIHIGAGTYVSFHAVILSHDMSRLLHADTFIGKNCFIGAYAIILPGITVGDHCIIGAGSVVTRDVPSHSMCAGNPARILRSNIRTLKWGILEESHAAATNL